MPEAVGHGGVRQRVQWERRRGGVKERERLWRLEGDVAIMRSREEAVEH
jgi:hypothetical protein